MKRNSCNELTPAKIHSCAYDIIVRVNKHDQIPQPLFGYIVTASHSALEDRQGISFPSKMITKFCNATESLYLTRECQPELSALMKFPWNMN